MDVRVVLGDGWLTRNEHPYVVHRVVGIRHRAAVTHRNTAGSRAITSYDVEDTHDSARPVPRQIRTYLASAATAGLMCFFEVAQLTHPDPRGVPVSRTRKSLVSRVIALIVFVAAFVSILAWVAHHQVKNRGGWGTRRRR